MKQDAIIRNSAFFFTNQTDNIVTQTVIVSAFYTNT